MQKFYNRQDTDDVVYRPATTTLAQTPMLATCTHLAKKHHLDWFITTDVDEYIFLPKNYIAQEEESQKQATSPPTENVASESMPPLKRFLRRFDKSTFASLMLNSIPFGSNKFVNESYPSPTLMMDHVWRRHLNITDYPFNHMKQIFNAHVVQEISVHWCHQAKPGTMANFKVYPGSDGIYLQHYKTAHKGVFDDQIEGMLTSPNDLVRDATLRDMYKADVVERLLELKTSV
jgi:Glycosyltransferase family 92